MATNRDENQTNPPVATEKDATGFTNHDAACTPQATEAEARVGEAALAEDGIGYLITYRALADGGRRATLADLLPKAGPLTLAQADAWLESAQPIEIDQNWTERIAHTTISPWPPIVCERWRKLLVAEAKLACGGLDAPAEADLRELVSTIDDRPPNSFEAAETGRIAARAAAAIARAGLVEWRNDDRLFTHPAWRLIPDWEQKYLRGLLHWQLGSLSEAKSNLRAAVDVNPQQTAVRLALSILLADDSPEECLQLLDFAEPSREMCVARASMLARLGRYVEAEAALEPCDGRLGGEAARFSWARGRAQSRQRENLLRSALAELRGDWNLADNAWRAACPVDQHKSLLEARQMFAASCELKSLSPNQNWRRSLLATRLERLQHHIGQIPLSNDALFFRAVAATDGAPDRAVKDFQTLLLRRAWINRERRAGGGRIVFSGDALLRLGQADDAIRAYETAAVESSPGVKEKLAVASIYAELSRSDLVHLAETVARAIESSPQSAWPRLLAALALLIAGDAQTASAHLEAAAERGAEETIVRGLRAACDAVAGSGSAALTDEELAVLELPREAGAVMRWLCGAGAETARLKTLVSDLGDDWMDRCPANVQSAARRLLVAWCEESSWDQALELARRLENVGSEWAAELAVLTRVRHALDRAGRGDLEEAEKELRELEASL